MLTAGESALRSDLLDRRSRLQRVAASTDDGDHLRELLREVDAALERFDAGTYGLCRVCHGAIDPRRLVVDPLLRVCLECMSEEQRRALQHDLDTAAQVQAALLPRRDLAAGGWELHYRYEPAGPVSGDYLDVILPATAGEPLHFVFGDVSGKGISASMLMAELKAIFRALIRPDGSLAEIVGQADRLFAEGSLPNHFATLVAGRLYASGRVELVNAGHDPPLVLAGGDAHALPADGLPLGMLPGGGYGSSRIQIAPGESLFLYTDGLTEAADPTGEEYGIERLRQVLEPSCRRSPRELVERCLAGLAAFQAGAPRGDDLTVMAVRRRAGESADRVV